jgi:ABC-2 type transport system permease protein
MTTLIRGELIKAITTRTIFAYAAMAVVLAVGQVLASLLPGWGDLMSQDDKKEALGGLPLLVLLLAIVGAAGEYRHRTAAPAALVAARDAGRLLVARAGAYAVAGAAVAALATVITLAVGLPLLADRPGPVVSAGDVALIAGGSLVAAALLAVFGVALGALVRNQVAAVTGTLIVIFVVLPLVQALSGTILDVTPFGAAQGVAGAGLTTLSTGAAAVVLVSWTLVALVAAVVGERRRDIA